MRGPHDAELLKARLALAPAVESTTRLPGGKALSRLCDMLDARGLRNAARTRVELAVPQSQRALFGARSAEDREDAPEHADALARALLEMGPAGPPGPGPQWRSLGPTTIPNGQTYGALRVNVSGRISTIAVDPQNAAHVLCGAANGGVWESFDRGGAWAPRTDYAPTTTVGAIAFHPTNTKIVYCGTGEGNWWSWLGVGILRSTDGGTNWSILCTTPFTGQGFYDLHIDSQRTKRMLAATTGGLYLSTDGGVTWRSKHAAPTWSIAGSRSELLVGAQDGVFRSTDGGNTFTPVALPGAPGAYARVAVAVAPANASVAYVWAASGDSAFLWRRAAGVWSAVTALPPGVSTGQAWYDWFAAVALDNPEQVYLGAIEAYRGDLTGAIWTWTVISNHTTAAIHPDQHAIAFEPGNPSTLYVGSDGGLYRSPDRGNSWVSCNNGLVISEFEYLADNPGTTRWLIGGTQDNGTERWTGASAWTHVADGDGGYVAVNHNDPRTVFHTYYGMSLDRSVTAGDFDSWTYIPPPVPAGEGGRFYPPMRCTDSNGNTVAMVGGALYVSRNDGADWTRLPFPSLTSGSAICVPDADHVFVGTDAGTLHQTHWDGAAWSPLAGLTAPRSSGAVSDLMVKPGALRRLWATYSTVGGGLAYRSDDGGSSWLDCSAGLPALPVNAIECDANDPNRVWVALDRGVWETRDAGAHWSDFSNALPNAYVGDLCFHPFARVLRAGTRNRGAWEIPVDGWQTGPVCGIQFTGTVAASQTQTWFTFNWPATWHVVWTLMPVVPYATGPQLSLSVRVQRVSAEFATYYLSVQNLTSVPVTFEGRFAILSYY